MAQNAAVKDCLSWGRIGCWAMYTPVGRAPANAVPEAMRVPVLFSRRRELPKSRKSRKVAKHCRISRILRPCSPCKYELSPERNAAATGPAAGTHSRKQQVYFQLEVSSVQGMTRAARRGLDFLIGGLATRECGQGTLVGRVLRFQNVEVGLSAFLVYFL